MKDEYILGTIFATICFTSISTDYAMKIKTVSLGVQFSTCVTFISKFLIKNDTKCMFVFDINHDFNNPIVLYNTKEEVISTQNWRLKPDVYFANLSGISLRSFFRIIGKHSEYNPLAKFFLLMDNITSETKAELSRYFTSQAISVPSKCEYSAQNDSDEIENVKEYLNAMQTKVTQWNNSSLKICFLDETLPPYSLYTLCPNCSTIGGLSFDVVDIVLERLNITRLDQRLSGSDLSTTNLKDWLSNGMCDIVFSPLIIDDSLLDYIFPVNDDELVWFAPSPGKLSKWRYLTKVFSVEVWIIWGIASLITITIWITLENIQTNLIENEATGQREVSISEYNIMRRVCYLFLYETVVISKLFLEQSHKFNIRNLFRATLIATIVLTTLTINLMYKTRFTSLLLGPDIYEESIKSLEDIVDHKLFVSFAEWRLSAFDGTSSKVRDYFKSHNTECETIPPCLERMNKFKDLALLMSIENVKYDYEKYLDKDGRNIIEPIYPRFVKPLYGTISLRGHPFTQILSEGIQRLRDHGFLTLIISKYSSKYHQNEHPEDKKLTLDQLRGPFLILIVGIFIGTIIFLLEVMLKYFRKK